MKKIYLACLFTFCILSLNAQTDLRCLTLGQPDGTQTQFNEIGYYLNNSPVEYNGCQTNSAIIIAVIDNSCIPLSTCDNNFGQANEFVQTSGTCGIDAEGYIPGCNRTRPENYFIFHFNSPQEMNSMNSMLNNIPNNNYILAYTWYTFPYSTVPVFSTAFQSLGATTISTLQDNFPYIFFMKKGDPLSISEIAGSSVGDTLTLNSTLSCSASSVPEMNRNILTINFIPVENTIRFSSMLNDYDWKIYDLKGGLIKSGFIKREMEISVGKLSVGNYFLRLENNNQTINKLFTVTDF